MSRKSFGSFAGNSRAAGRGIARVPRNLSKRLPRQELYDVRKKSGNLDPSCHCPTHQSNQYYCRLLSQPPCPSMRTSYVNGPLKFALYYVKWYPMTNALHSRRHKSAEQLYFGRAISLTTILPSKWALGPMGDFPESPLSTPSLLEFPAESIWLNSHLLWGTLERKTTP